MFSSLRAESLEQLNKDIATHKAEIKETELKIEHQMVDSQQEMIGDWSSYANEMVEVKRHQDKLKQLEKELQELEEKKQLLMHSAH